MNQQSQIKEQQQNDFYQHLQSKALKKQQIKQKIHQNQPNKKDLKNQEQKSKVQEQEVQEQEQEEQEDENQDYSDNDQKFVIGTATFRSQAQLFQISEQIIQTLESDTWYIAYDRYQLQNWGLLFSYMLQCSANEITFVVHKYPHIPRQIFHVNFTNLTRLHIGQNHIQNIQTLCLVQLSNVKTLIISRNNISRLTCFKKITIPNINYFCIHDNYIYEINSLSKAYLNFGVLECFQIEKFLSDKHYCEDLSQLVKLNIRGGFQELCIRSKKRIYQGRLRWRLQEKFEQIRCFDWEDDI